MSKKIKLSSFEQAILDFLKEHEGQKVPADVLYHALGLTRKKDLTKIAKSINRLSTLHIIRKTKNGLAEYIAPKEGDESAQAVEHQDPNILIGTLRITRQGYGFLEVTGRTSDIRIGRKEMGTALPDDKVKVRTFHHKGRLEGKVIDILERGRRIYVGTLIKENKFSWTIEPDEKSAHVDFYVPHNEVGEAQHFDKVVFELVQWTDQRAAPQARIVEVLGQKGSNDADVLSILAENQLRSSFHPDVERYAERIPVEIPKSEYERRLDLREEGIFTIDPEDAKDFDDAIHIVKLDNGNLKLGVHIADVTYYMPKDTILDQEALVRGTSTYLVDRVIPMLPEKLSNGVCSLNPMEDKLAYSCIMEVDEHGTVVAYTIAETVIYSKHRFTYEQAQEVIDTGKGPFAEELKLLSEFTQKLTKRRLKKGAIDFESPEPRFRLDPSGKPLEVFVKERLIAHRLIEECMLLANRTVSEHIEYLRKSSGKKVEKELFPFLYRIHDKPDQEKLMNIAEHVKPLNIKFDLDKKVVTPNMINKLLNDVKGTTLEQIVNSLMLRAMAKAEYSPHNIGHFGLSFAHYTHFTSPIRRYPDVIVHRILKAYAQEKKPYSYDDLVDLGKRTSERERAAMTAERDSVKLKQVEYLSDRIGQDFEGIISGVTENGIFVVLKDSYCEGMVHISAFKDDFYRYDGRLHMLVGRTRGRKYQLGMTVSVKVHDTDIASRRIDFILAKP